MAEALYTKYRPQVFEDVVGQEHIERTIKNAIEQDKVSHAYLFCGPRGTGKTTTARLLAKALLCQKGPTAEPDGTCEDCKLIAAGEHPDVYELDAASRTGVDNVREEIIGRVQFAPTRGRYKVYIIDEVHMLSVAAFNALLKTLEEPPSHVVFILATTDPQKVPETIHSRCQRFDFRRISAEAMVARLGAVCVSEGVEFEGDALELIAHRAEGGLRNALTSLEQIIAFGEGKVTLRGAESMLGSLDSSELSEIMEAIGSRDAAACFRWVAQYVETGADLARFTHDLAEHVRNLYVMSLAGADVALEVSAAQRRELEAELPRFGSDRLERLLGLLGDLSIELKTSTNPRLSFEIALTRMVRPDSDLTLEALAERIEALEAGYAATSHVVGGLAPAAASAASADVRGGWDNRERQGFSPDQRGAATSSPQYLAQQPSQRPQQNASARAAAELCADAMPQTQVGAGQVQPQSQPQPQAFQTQAQSQAAYGAEQPASSGQAQAISAQGGDALSADLASTLRNEAALQRMWSSAIASLKKSKAAYGVLFMNTKAVFDDARGALIIEFPKENSFAFKAVQKPDVQDAVSAAIASSCGSAVAFSFSQGPAGASALSSGAQGVEAASSARASAGQARSATEGVRPSAARAAAEAALREVREREVARAGEPVPSRVTQQQGHSRAAQQKQPQPQARAAQGWGSGRASQVSPQGASAFAAPEPDPVPLDAYGQAPYEEPVPYGDVDVPFDESSARSGGRGPENAPAQLRPRVPSSASSQVRAAQAAQASPGFSRGDQSASDVRTSASVEACSPTGEPVDGTFGSSEDLAALLAAGGFAGAHVEEMRE